MPLYACQKTLGIQRYKCGATESRITCLALNFVTATQFKIDFTHNNETTGVTGKNLGFNSNNTPFNIF